MAKNIVLCSDGTGNQGGRGVGTNVYKTCNAVDIHHPEVEQVTFYDNGVGTNKNKYLRALTGAFGLGFKQNVEDLYEFLARHYDSEKKNVGPDKIFLFGFSRGAATVRAFAGMIQECGLLCINRDEQGNKNYDEQEFQRLLKLAMKAYVKHKSNPSYLEKFRSEVKEPFSIASSVGVEMVGVWDTVSALGFPQDWSGAVNGFFWLVERIFNCIWPHKFYNYRLNQNVKNVYHALAIDDERKTFHPKLWNETRADRPVNIEQVWFTGAHSNVGGGYPRAGLSTVALDWMMERAVHHGVKFKASTRESARNDANVHGKLYDSRDGAAVYYRYAPRDIVALCENEKKSILHFWAKKKKQKVKLGEVKIHASVIDRIKRGTSRYAPGLLPYEFKIVFTPIGQPPVLVTAASGRTQWATNREEIIRRIFWRKTLYRAFVESSLAVLLVTAWFWIYQPAADFSSKPNEIFASVLRPIASALNYVMPAFFEEIITFVLVRDPIWLLIVVVIFTAMFLIRGRLRGLAQASSEKARQAVLGQLPQLEQDDQP